MKLQVLPLSQEAFSAYGDVIETQQRDFFHINNGLVERYHDLALVEILEQDRTLISINRAQPTNFPHFFPDIAESQFPALTPVRPSVPQAPPVLACRAV